MVVSGISRAIKATLLLIVREFEYLKTVQGSLDCHHRTLAMESLKW